jgi:hypothetical protein
MLAALVALSLSAGTPLPPSQLVREQIRAAPGSDAILIRSGALLVPE